MELRPGLMELVAAQGLTWPEALEYQNEVCPHHWDHLTLSQRHLARKVGCLVWLAGLNLTSQ